MSESIQCPSCHQEIEGSRILDYSIICHCGHTVDRIGKIKKQTYRRAFLTGLLSLSGLLLALSLIHISKWGSHSVEVLPILSAQISGNLSEKLLVKLDAICKNKGNLECRISALEKLNNHFPKVQYKAQLGHFYFAYGSDKKAALLLEDVISKDPTHFQARYDLARVYGHLGEVELSQKQFRKLFAEKPNTLMVSVTQAYVSMLITNKLYHEAKITIHEARKHEGTEFILAKELQLIETELLAQN
ncbi:MAG: hypothetical protein KDD61_12455 [Bdellovibrionales bacterium]|nr:hypothetical protein [Bdellovibrionales bacterium]